MARRKTKSERADAPIKYRGAPAAPQDFRSFMEEWSISQAEANHVETIEEANDFEIFEEEDDIFSPELTVYEMHEAAEETLALLEHSQPEQLQAESNETGDAGAINSQNSHDQSAPLELNSPEDSSLSSQQTPIHSSS